MNAGQPLNNAFKYSDRDSCVLLGIKAQEHAIQLSVVMKGTGISRQDLKNIFDRYFRCDTGRSKSDCGPGLSLVRTVTMAHGTTIDVNSTTGAGSEFRITLPT
jgi:signal transduction histidine kinase